MFVKYASALLVLWYSLSVIGFDVHSCTSTGEVFVASLAGGITCEDIHPEHSCKSYGGCCGHHDVSPCCANHHASSCCDNKHASEQSDCQVAKEECCTNDLQILQLTGVIGSGNERFDGNDHEHQFTFDVDMAMELAMPALQRPFLKYLEHPDPGVVMPDRQAFFSIWRV